MWQSQRSKRIETGMFSFIKSKTLALMTVQRQAAASRLTRFSTRLQEGYVRGDQIPSLTEPSTLAHAFNSRPSLKQL